MILFHESGMAIYNLTIDDELKSQKINNKSQTKKLTAKCKMLKMHRKANSQQLIAQRTQRIPHGS